jgi:hypothetical protein
MEAMTDPNIYSTAGSIAAPTATKTHFGQPSHGDKFDKLASSEKHGSRQHVVLV